MQKRRSRAVKALLGEVFLLRLGKSNKEYIEVLAVSRKGQLYGCMLDGCGHGFLTVPLLLLSIGVHGAVLRDSLNGYWGIRLAKVVCERVGE